MSHTSRVQLRYCMNRSRYGWGARQIALVCVVVATCATLTTTTKATVIAGSSSGYGLDVGINALLVNLNVGPLPSGDSGSAPAPYNLSTSVVNVNVTSSSVLAQGAVTAQSINGAALSNVDGSNGSKTTSAGGGVVGANVGITALLGVSPLALNGTLNSTAQIFGDYGSLAAAGTTTIQQLGLTILGVPVDLSAYVGVDVAPNTSIDLGALGIANATLTLNEQIVSPDQTSIVVNAFDLSFSAVLGTIHGDVILGHSEAHVAAVPEPTTWTMAVLGLVFTGFAAWRHRNRSAMTGRFSAHRCSTTCRPSKSPGSCKSDRR